MLTNLFEDVYIDFKTCEIIDFSSCETTVLSLEQKYNTLLDMFGHKERFYGIKGVLLVWQGFRNTRIWYNGGLIQLCVNERGVNIDFTDIIGLINNKIVVADCISYKVWNISSYKTIKNMTETQFRKYVVLNG